MSILGIESVVFGVTDLAEHTRFWTDFGLPPKSATADESVFELASGSRVFLYRHGDPRLPADGCVLETEFAVIDATVETQLRAIEKALIQSIQ